MSCSAGKSVDGDNKFKIFEILPLRRDLAERAGHELHVDAAFHQFRQKDQQLPITDHGIAADDGEVQGPQFIHDRENALYKLVSLVRRTVGAT